ncbi:MAG: hypothetical protein ABR884_00220 [Minisyncoccia bacterium]|jgi:hypothetical protein
MDEGEKPFPIEFIVILLIVAVANDVAEIFFDLLDFTGVGVAGEAIMEPANFVLDFFFTGIFWWKVGPGGGTITQYIGDILEPFLIPGRTISVGLGMWIANHPNSAIGEAANTAVSLESGNVAGATGEVEGIAGTAEKEAADAEKKLQGGSASGTGEGGEGGLEAAKEGQTAESKSPEAQSGGEKENAPEEDVFKNPYENPVGTAGEELNEPPEEEFHEGEGFKPKEEPQENEIQSQKVVDIASRRPPSPKNENRAGDADAEDLAEAA